MVALVVACGGEPAPAEEPAPTTTEGTERSGEPMAEPTDDPVSEPSEAGEPTVEPMGRCHVSCCSPRVLEMQAQSDDPSIQNECCFCDD